MVVFSRMAMFMVLLLWSCQVSADCKIPDPDEGAENPTPPALVATIAKLDSEKKKVELKSAAGSIFVVDFKAIEGKLVSGYGGSGEIKDLQVGYELKIWQANCQPLKGKKIKPAHIIYMKPSWYQNKD